MLGWGGSVLGSAALSVLVLQYTTYWARVFCSRQNPNRGKAVNNGLGKRPELYVFCALTKKESCFDATPGSIK